MTLAVLDHLWQSTLAALAVVILMTAFRKAAAAVRYGLWFAASAKFLIPFAALAALGRVLAPAVRVPAAAAPAAMFLARAARPFSPSAFARSSFPRSALSQVSFPHAALARAHAAPATYAAHRLDPALILAAVWALGCIAVLVAWLVRSARVRAIVRSATPLPWPAPMPVLASASLLEPGLVGLWRPVLLVPNTLPEHLGRAEIDAVLAHEACHLRRRDNLTAAIHMVVEALFWFHPLVWWIGARLIEEREKACDEAVVRSGHDRAAYARSLVEICRLYLQSPLPCVAGASGSKLKTRVRLIMSGPPSSPLSPARKTLLLAAGACAVGAPVAAGLLTSPAGRQAVAHAAAVASGLVPVRLNDPRAAAPTDAASSPRGKAPAILVARNQAVPTPDRSGEAAEAPPPASAPDSPAPAAAPAPLAVAPTTTQPEPATRIGAVTVRAPPSPAEVRKQTRSFVGSFAAATVKIDQIARWRDPLCVQVAGLVPGEAAEVKARVEDVAKAVGRSVLQPGCRPNVEIVFADRPQGVLDAVAARREPVLGYDHRREAKALKAVTRPIQAWYVTATEGGGATVGNPGVVLGGFPAQTLGRLVDDPDSWPPTGCADSPRFSSCRQSVFDNVLVVVDSGRVRDKSLGLVSDYVAMLALSQPKSLDGCNALPSVTDLFAAACPGRDAPDGLTPADAAYLTALYAADPQANKAGQQSEIAWRMAKILVSANVNANTRAF
jgi:beta-lactamase regulating signal transducer with metallopeptidase domain